MDLQELALSLKGKTEFLTCRSVQQWVHDNIRYEFHQYAEGVEQTWQCREGDCTDMAMLIQDLLRLNDIPSRTVHGYGTWTIPNQGDVRFKHDWLIATYHQIDGAVAEMILDGCYGCLKYEQIGDGIW
jgi:transglutaminase-like putative cysteine protease